MMALPRRNRWLAGLRRLILRPLTPLLQRWFRRHYAVERRWRRQGLDILVQPGVFPPGPTVSTAVLLDHFARRFPGTALAGRRVLDLGCGTGLVGLFLARAGAWVVSSDINPAALANARLNAVRNGLILRPVLADQATSFAPDAFDLIIITPPYYPRDPASMAERAWFCGDDFAYFRRLAPQLAALDLSRTEVLMLLSEDCAVETINAILSGQGLGLRLVHAKRSWLEMTWLLRVVAYAKPTDVGASA
ncbi:methyltransferase [Niveispirillum sp. BGYR6]|uniref:methyltransferase n=1 Tax=Niveispirillum sp. BGYR6 TaxID=2971249 RepID=UPI0022B9A18F|nr:methyltransferase [Niveispirillum sp. BGYR6]MDG5497994.1 methyltransferase [Niveispirillum sp. BGYR6]